MTSQTPKATEIEEMIKEARLAFYKRHAKQQYPKSLVTILDSFDVEFRQALLSQQQKYRETNGSWLRKIIEVRKDPSKSTKDLIDLIDQAELLNSVKKDWDKQAENMMNGLDQEVSK